MKTCSYEVYQIRHCHNTQDHALRSSYLTQNTFMPYALNILSLLALCKNMNSHFRHLFSERSQLVQK